MIIFNYNQMWVHVKIGGIVASEIIAIHIRIRIRFEDVRAYSRAADRVGGGVRRRRGMG